jgi:hypothetical protein
MIVLLFLFIAFGLLAVLASAFGVDSRDDSTDPRRPEYPVGIH